MWLDIRIHPKARDYRPYLNGEKLSNCFAAKESSWWRKGWADCYQTDEEGQYILTEDRKELKTIRLYGHVVLKKEKGE